MTRLRIAALGLFVVALLPAVGCRPADAGDPGAPPPIDRSSALAATRSMLTLMQLERQAIRDKRPARAQMLLAEQRKLMDSDYLVARLNQLPRFRQMLPDGDPMDGMLAHWGAALAYYLDGVDFGTLLEQGGVELTDKRRSAEVSVTARGKEDTATLRIICSPDTDGWRILQMDFARPAEVRMLEPRPASSPTGPTVAPPVTSAPTSPGTP